MKNKKIFNLITITMVSVVLLGNSTTDVYKKVRKNQSLINDVYRYLITNYVDNIDIDAFTKMSINNMLIELDPYTTYMENEEKDGIEMLTKGKYGGVGIQIGIREKQLTVISPMDNSPAKRAGILSGDKIIKIDDIETISYKIDDAAKLIRGKQGTVVKLTIQRYGDSELIDFPLIRENIAVKDISYAGMLDKHNGYIRLTRFSRNSAKEMKLAIKDLLEKEMSGLILDLRDNPGGLLNSAVDILDLFIDKGETLVWTEGRSKKSFRKYNSNTSPLVPKDINLTVLVNKGSASASEIIAGTLQDLDRGVVIGRPTFGKGLVQTVFNIDRDSKTKFKGLPAPVNALFIVSLPLLIENPLLMDLRYSIESQATLLTIIIISCILMNNNIPFFSLKSISFKNERLKILVLLILSVPLFSIFNFASFPMIILIYVILNLLVIIGRKLGLS